MSRERIVPQLSEHFVVVSELVYSQEKISVYRGTYQSYAAAIKVQYVSPGVSAGQLESEFRTIQSLAHPNILRLYDCFWANNESQYFLVFVSEWCAKDLGKDLAQRTQNDYPWTESELWVIVRKLIAAFGYMQQAGIAHCDIKPANIFLMADKEPRVGDFGSALNVTNFVTPVIGTPKYLSPKIREALYGHRDRVHHNPFKSDVYSLGVTFYELASLDTHTALARADSMEQAVDTIRFSEEFKGLLRLMLKRDEDQRPDFLYLQSCISPAEVTLEVPQGVLPEVPQIVPPEPVLQCIKCGKVVAKDSVTALRLACDPEKHLFCAVDCFVVWGSSQIKEFAYCPHCKKEVDEKLIKDHNITFQVETSGRPSDAESSANGPTATETEAALINKSAPAAAEIGMPYPKDIKSTSHPATRQRRASFCRSLCSCCFTPN